jgi:hypothetical protein
MMTTPADRPHWSTRGLERLAQAFVAQEHVGILGGLMLRLARYLQGDPSATIGVAAGFGVTAQLPDNAPALTAVVVVTAQPIFFRTDGIPPTSLDPILQPGTVITLTGQPSIKGFRFTTATATPASVNGSFYD